MGPGPEVGVATDNVRPLFLVSQRTNPCPVWRMAGRERQAYILPAMTPGRSRGKNRAGANQGDQSLSPALPGRHSNATAVRLPTPRRAPFPLLLDTGRTPASAKPFPSRPTPRFVGGGLVGTGEIGRAHV